MEREDQGSEDSQHSVGKSDIVLLIALTAFIVFLTVGVFLILFDARGQAYYSDRIRPFFTWQILENLFW